MAGLDGIKNKIHPGEAMDKNLYDLPPEEAKEIPQVAGSLEEALNALDADREFLTLVACSPTTLSMLTSPCVLKRTTAYV
jgi:glutamine synthetase